jgi:hypothetical protein
MNYKSEKMGEHVPPDIPDADQVLRMCKHPLLTVHTRRELGFLIMNAELSAVKVSVPRTAELSV